MPTEEGILVVTTSFFHGRKLIHKGDTVRAGHPFTELYPRFLRPLQVDFDFDDKPKSRHAKSEEKPEPKTSSVKFADPPPSKK